MPKQQKWTAAAALAVLACAPAFASSHREAPDTTKMPKVDGTDFYMFNSYEPGRSNYVTILANYLPLQDSYGGPNFFSLDPDAMYAIHVDNNGDAIEDITFQFRVVEPLRNAGRGLEIPVGGQMVAVPLINIGGIPGGGQNRIESYTLRVVRGPQSGPSSASFASDASTGAMRFPKPVDNIGNKSIPNYPSYADSFVRTINIPGCTAGTARVFVGQRRESFAVNLGEVFDLVNIANPLGPRDAEPNVLDDKNITTIALEVPKSCLTSGSRTVIGGWTTAWLPQNRRFNFGTIGGGSATAEESEAIQLADDAAATDDGGMRNLTGANHITNSGPFAQVSRLGMPLVNEVVIGLRDKNKFNWSPPKNDAANFATYVTNPTLPELLEILFGAAGVRAPNNFPRTDLLAAFVTGVAGLNADGGVGEMLRLNTSIAATAAGAQNNLGVLGGDNAGFPNGRRPGDDVVDIELRVAMGVLCHAFPGVFCTPADAPSGNLPFTDGTLQDASQFDSTFPYLKDPIPGSPNGANGEGL